MKQDSNVSNSDFGFNFQKSIPPKNAGKIVLCHKRKTQKLEQADFLHTDP